MKEKALNIHNGKEYILSTYFIINNGKLYSTTNFNIEENFKSCFYVKKVGSNIHPKIYLSIKINNEWIETNQLIGGYNQLMEIIAKNQSKLICIRGFSRAGITQFIRMINETKGTNIKPVKPKNKIVEEQHEKHLSLKEQAIDELQNRIENLDERESEKQFMMIAYPVFGEHRHESRKRLIKSMKK